MKKIIVFTSDLYQGGVAESTRKIAKLLHNDFEISLCSYDSLPINKKLPINTSLYLLNCPLSAGFRKEKCSRFCVAIARYLFFPIALIKFVLLVRKVKPDCVYSMTYIPNIINLIASLLMKYKSIISERQDPREDLRDGSIIAHVLKSLYPMSDIVHANSLEMIDAIEQYYNIAREKIVHIDNFFFFDEILVLGREDAPAEIISGSKFKMVTSGRLSKQKGQWHLFPILKRLRDRGVDINLIILGDGELKCEFKKIVSELLLTDHVFFVGDVDNPHKYVSKCDLFIFPSIWESFGNTLVEAMALGIPVASTICKSGPKQIINGGEFGVNLGVFPPYGHSLDDNAVDDISDKIISVLCDESEIYTKMSSDGFDRFSEQAAYQKFIDMINQ